MSIQQEKEKFEFLVDELRKCGYLESEVYAIARIDNAKFAEITEEKLKTGNKVLESQLSFAKKCLKAI